MKKIKKQEAINLAKEKIQEVNKNYDETKANVDKSLQQVKDELNNNQNKTNEEN